MKLRNLNGVVRKAAGKITIKVQAPDGRAICVSVPKSLLVEGLKDAYANEDPTYETRLTINDAGVLVQEGAADVDDGPTHDETGDLLGEHDDLGEPDMSDDALYTPRPGRPYTKRTPDEDDDLLDIEDDDLDKSLAALTNEAAGDDLDDLLG